MNPIKAFAVNMALDMVVDVLSDMATKEGVVKFRDDVIKIGYEITGKTETELDDRCWRWVAQTVLTPSGWMDYGEFVVRWAKEYVIASETKYDDYALPVLIALETAFSE